MARTRKERRSSSGREALRKNGMMAHLLDSLDAGQDIGHFGRLVFAMVARHFMDDAELRETLMQDPVCDERQALSLVEQVKGRDYSPPRREFRSCCMMRWIFRLIVMTVAAKLVNRFLESRYSQPRSRG